MSEAQIAASHNSGQLNQKKRRVGDGTPGPGRPKGLGNKLTENIREAIELAAKKCHPQGLAGWLVDRANGGLGDRQIFAGLVGRVVPLQVNQNVNGGISINLNWLGGRQIGTVSAQPRVIDAQTVELIQHSEPERWIADANSTQATAPEPVGAAQAPAGYPGTNQPEIVQPAPSNGPSRGIGDDPPSPLEAGPGGPA